jgi:hypothetical protein
MENFNTMPENARVWVYQANKELSESEIKFIKESGERFVGGWAAHGAPLRAAFDVLYKRFVILMVDEEQAMASGCSIDSSVRFIKELEAALKLDFFNRLLICYKDNEHIASFSMNETEDLLKKGIINGDTIIFNNTVSTKKQFDLEWQIPLKSSWLNRFLTVNI